MVVRTNRVVFFAGVLLCLGPFTHADQFNPTGRPVGGGEGYGDWITQDNADYVIPKEDPTPAAQASAPSDRWEPTTPLGYDPSKRIIRRSQRNPARLAEAQQAQRRRLQAANKDQSLQANRVVSHEANAAARDQLLDALRQAKPGQVIYIRDDAEIDLSGEWEIEIPAGVTLASGRGREGSLGARLYTKTQEKRTLFQVTGGGVRITGLRIQGPSVEIDGPGCEQIDPTGIRITHTISETNPDPVHRRVEIDNCELWAWQWAAIATQGVTGVHVHHNHIHHNRREEKTEDGMGCGKANKTHYGLGYGVVTSQGHVLVEANIFDNNRHDIASNGKPGSSYTAKYNLVLDGAIQHSFDMHGGKDRNDGTDIAGDVIEIHYNTFLQANKPAVKIRGIPQCGASVFHNRFRHTLEQDAIQQCGTGNLLASNNQFGVNFFPMWRISYSGRSFWTWRRFDLAPMASMRVGDFDGDQQDDLFHIAGLQWRVSAGARQPWKHQVFLAQTVDQLAFGDFDGNGITDAFCPLGETWWVSWGARQGWASINIVDPAPPLDQLGFGDFDGDKHTDVFYADAQGWHVSWSGQSSWVPINPKMVGFRVDQLGFGDFDGDGKTDVFYADGQTWWVSKAAVEEWEKLNASKRTLDQLGFGDFNGDGITDVFYADGKKWQVSWGGKTLWEKINDNPARLGELIFGDFNGDGATDTLVSHSP